MTQTTTDLRQPLARVRTVLIALILSATFIAFTTSAAAAPIEVTTGAPTSTTECTLADAYAAAQAGASLGACTWTGNASINLEAGSTYWLASSLPPLTSPVGISGPSASPDPPRIAWQTGASGRFFDVAAGGRLNLDVVELSGGTADDGGAVRVQAGGSLHAFRVVFSDNHASLHGGAIDNEGDVTLDSSTLDSNSSANWGGALSNRGSGTVSIERSLLVDNEALIGGALYQQGGPIEIDISTLSANRAAGYGGGLYVKSGSVAIDWSTLRDNEADLGFGSAFLFEWGALDLGRSIVTAEPSMGSLCYGSQYVTSAGGNAFSDSTCGTPAADDVLVGGPIALSELVDHGGATKAHVPLCDWSAGTCESPVFDHIPCCALGECPAGEAPVRDVRDQFPRRDIVGGTTAASGGAACDIGAYESVCEAYTIQDNGPGETVIVDLHEQQVVNSARPVLLDNGACFTHPLFDQAGTNCRILWVVAGPTLAVRDVVFIESDCAYDCFAAPEDCAAHCAVADPVGWIDSQDLPSRVFGFDVPSCTWPTGSGRYLLVLEDSLDPGPTWFVDPQTPIDVDTDD